MFEQAYFKKVMKVGPVGSRAGREAEAKEACRVVADQINLMRVVKRIQIKLEI